MMIINPTCPEMPGRHRRKRTTMRQHRKRVVEWKMIPKRMMIWAHKGTHPATCPKKRTMIGTIATTTWLRGISSDSHRMAICMDEPCEAQHMAGFIALQMSRLWAMFEAGEKRAIDAALEGIPACPYHNDLGRYPNITEFDRDGIILPSTEHKISQFRNVRTRTYRTVGERAQYIRYLAYKCEGLYVFYKLWIAAKILDITKDEMKLLVSERRHPVGDIVYRCFSLAFNCKYISFARTGLNLGRHGYVVNVSAIIAATDPGKCDERTLACRRASQEVCPSTRSPTQFGRGIPSTHH